MKLIIAATDGSQVAERAVAIAADLVKTINAKLLIVNVSEDKLSTAQIRLIDRLRISEGDALEEISGRILSRAKPIAQKHGAANIETMIGSGHSAKVLLKIRQHQTRVRDSGWKARSRAIQRVTARQRFAEASKSSTLHCHCCPVRLYRMHEAF